MKRPSATEMLRALKPKRSMYRRYRSQEREQYDLRGRSCALGGELAEGLERREAWAWLMLAEIGRPHQLPDGRIA